MKIISKDFKRNYVRLQVENLDDLWYLTYIIEEGDLLKAKTYRKIKLGRDDQRNSKIVKKKILLTIEVEKTEFAKYSNVLRVSGIIREGPEDVSIGSHHTVNIEENFEFSLQKESFLKYQIKKINEAAKSKKENILLVVHDREDAYFAMLKKYGYEVLSHVSVNAEKKGDMESKKEDLFPVIKKKIGEYDSRYSFSRIVIASPGFWREYIKKIIKNDDLKKKIIYATCSSASENGINEVMKRQEVQQALREEKFAEETQLVQKLLEEISKEGKSEYGLEQVKKVTEAGAVSDLLITDKMIQERRRDENFKEIEEVMKKVEQMNGEIHIISSEHEGGNKLDGLGGIAALLRYKLNY